MGDLARESACNHEHQEVGARVVGLDEGEGVHRFLAEMSITCADCGEPFGFRGLPCGVSTAGGAYVDPAATELRVVLYSPSDLALVGPLPGLADQPSRLAALSLGELQLLHLGLAVIGEQKRVDHALEETWGDLLSEVGHAASARAQDG